MINLEINFILFNIFFFLIMFVLIYNLTMATMSSSLLEKKNIFFKLILWILLLLFIEVHKNLKFETIFVVVVLNQRANIVIEIFSKGSLYK